MKILIACTLAAIVAIVVVHTEPYWHAQSPVVNTITVTGSDPSAPIPVSVTIQTHTDGRITWKRP